jgi:hypothetical protein
MVCYVWYRVSTQVQGYRQQIITLVCRFGPNDPYYRSWHKAMIYNS